MPSEGNESSYIAICRLGPCCLFVTAAALPVSMCRVDERVLRAPSMSAIDELALMEQRRRIVFVGRLCGCIGRLFGSAGIHSAMKGLVIQIVDARASAKGWLICSIL